MTNMNEHIRLDKQLENKHLFVDFNEETHTYKLKSNGKELMSVTRLLEKLGVSPSYDDVDKELLEKSASYGKAIHKEIEDYIKHDIKGVSVELDNFIKWLNNSPYMVVGSELIVCNNVVAGTLDLLLWNVETEAFAIMDLKTTSVIHKASVKWQNSFYKSLFIHGEYVTENLCGHFKKDGTFEVVELKFVNEEYINDVFSQLREDNELHLPQIKLDEVIVQKVRNQVALIDTLKKEIEEHENKLKQFQEMVINAMEENGVNKYEDEFMNITYVAPVTRTSIDSAKLKKEQPKIAEKYSKTTITKASVRITLKEQE